MKKPELKEEQKIAVMHEAGDILVSASAGSGKTHVMITRAIRLICDGKTDVDGVLAVTFTESAAADMKDKLKHALIEKINQTKDVRLIKQLGLVQTADISTLHSFCGRLIRTYFFECGLSPDFSIADENDAKALRQTAIINLFKHLYKEKDQGFFKVLAWNGKKRSDKRLKELILDMFDFCEAEAEPWTLLDKSLYYYTETGFNELLEIGKADILSVAKKVMPILSEAKEYFSKTDVKPKLLAIAEGLLSDLKYLSTMQDLYAVYNLNLGAYDFRSTERPQDDVSKEYKNILSDCKKTIFTCINKYLSVLKGKEQDIVQNCQLKEHTEILSTLVKRFAEIYSNLKREENLLDFADLEHFALKILKNQEIRQAVRSKYKYIFVDEYQDVNGVQEEIISAIKNDNLFMVGDVKQSIYGFRGCNPDIFAEKFERMSKIPDATVKLNHNFRSANKVIEMVNKVFDYSMTEEFFGIDYKGTSELVPCGIFDDEYSGRAELHLLKTKSEKRSSDKEEPRIYDILKELNDVDDDVSATATLLADIIIKETHQKYYNVKTGEYKNVSFGDIAILTRNKKNSYVEGIVSGLVKRGIPVTSEVAETVCDYPEIQVLVCALKLVDCFVQDVPLATVLKSVVGGFSDEELAEISFVYADYCKENNLHGYSFYDAYAYSLASDTPLGERLREFDKRFSELRFIADFASASAVLEKLVEKSNFKAYLYATKSGDAKVRRVERFISAANKGGKNISVKEFLRVIENDPESLKLAECVGEDTVKIMTMHASKGLEFPVVIVCGLERKANSEEERETVLSDRRRGFAVKYYDDEERVATDTLLRTIIKDEMRKARLQEELRLFYVALTRATYSLHLTFLEKEDARKDTFDGANRFLDYVPKSIPLTEHEVSDLVIAGARAETREVLFGERVDERKLSNIKSNFAFLYPYQADTKLPLKTSVTAVATNVKQEYYQIDEKFKDNLSETDIERGIIAHKLLEVIDFANAEYFDEEIDRIISSGIMLKSEIEKINVEAIRKLVKSDVFKSLQGKRLFKEKGFIATVPTDILYGNGIQTGILVQGVIDLLVIDADGAKVIDYKYTSHNGEALRERYSKQLEIYAYAVEEILKIPVKDCFVVSLLTGEIVDIPLKR